MADEEFQHELMTTAEVAALVRMSERTLEGMRLRKEGPSYVKLGVGRRAKVVYSRKEVEAWLEANRVQCDSDR